MSVLRPKKTAPFNQTEKRALHKNNTKTNFPGSFISPRTLTIPIGPGAYDSKVGFEKQQLLTGMNSKDKFFTTDNGHLNLKPQSYSTIKKTITQI